MKPDADGWIAWNGGECPLDDGVPNRVKFRNGDVSPVDFNAPSWDWKHDAGDFDIVAYCVVEGEAA